MVTIRTAICHCYRLTIVAAQQDCKRPFSGALCAEAAAIIIHQPDAGGPCIRAEKRA